MMFWRKVMVPAELGGAVYHIEVKDFVYLKKAADLPPNKWGIGAGRRHGVSTGRGAGRGECQE
jgi:hypothetical protein